MGVIVNTTKGKTNVRVNGQASLENVIQIEQKSLLLLTEKICKADDCRYPLLALRLLIYVITSVDANGSVYISARHLSKKLGVNYDTVTKCLKYLREKEVLKIERK